MGRIRDTVSAAVVAVVLATAVCGPAVAQGATIYETRFLDPARAASDWGFPKGATDVTEKGFAAALTPGALTVTIDGAANAWLSPEIGDLPADQAIEARIASSTGDESALFGVA